MKNEQLAGARAALADFPECKVTIGQTSEGETITPYLSSDVFVRGEPVLIRATMSKEDVQKAMRLGFLNFRASLNG